MFHDSVDGGTRVETTTTTVTMMTTAVGNQRENDGNSVTVIQRLETVGGGCCSAG